MPMVGPIISPTQRFDPGDLEQFSSLELFHFKCFLQDLNTQAGVNSITGVIFMSSLFVGAMGKNEDQLHACWRGCIPFVHVAPKRFDRILKSIFTYKNAKCYFLCRHDDFFCTFGS